MNEDILAAKFLLDHLPAGRTCRNSIFRLIPGMLPDTARRRINDFRAEFERNNYYVEIPDPKRCGIILPLPGSPACTCNRKENTWTFSKQFLTWLKTKIRDAYMLEKQKVNHDKKI